MSSGPRIRLSGLPRTAAPGITRALGLAHYRHVEAVGFGRPWRHQHPSVRYPRSLAEHEASFPEAVAGQFARRHQGEAAMPAKEGRHLIAVLLLQHRTGHIGDPAARFQEREGAVEQVLLLLEPVSQCAG